MKVIFKNMKTSNIAKIVVEQKFLPIMEKYAVLKDHNITFTLEMENSPRQPGPDKFNASVMVAGKVYKLKLKRSSNNLYIAIADMLEGFKQLISRETDRLLTLQQRRYRHGPRKMAFIQD